MSALDKIFDEEKGEKGAAAAPAPEPQEPAATPAPAEPATEPAAAPSATPAPAASTEPAAKHVPLEALEAERTKRRDWKDRATRAEVERDMLREQMARADQPPAEPAPYDPIQAEFQAVQTFRLDQSEAAAVRDHGQDKVDAAFEAMTPIFKTEPALAAKIMQSPHPWAEMVKEHQRRELLKEVGEDPAAYRERVRNELKAEMMVAAPAAPAPAPTAPVIPQSLATARSSNVATRSAGGPASPLDRIFTN